MDVQFKELTDAQRSVMVRGLAGSLIARIQGGQGWTGRPYDLLEHERNHQDQVEIRFLLTTTREAQNRRKIFVLDSDERNADTSTCRSLVLGACSRPSLPA
jgi:hypothetical protein